VAIAIKVAETAGECDRALQLRYQVYVDEEERFAERADGRIFDRFDCFGSTGCVLATDMDSGVDVGTLRFAVQTDAGLPSDSFYDFSHVTRDLSGAIGTIGMLAVAREFRGHNGIVLGMMKVATRELRAAGVEHVVAPVSPDIEPALRAMGGQQVGESFTHGDPPVGMTPMHISWSELTPLFRETFLDPQGLLLDTVNERRIFQRGEVVVREGDPGDEAFLVMRGSVRVSFATGDGEQPIGLSGPGQLVGELALLDGGVRTATAVAHSQVLDVAVIPRREFQARMSSDPRFAPRVLTLLGQRARRSLRNEAAPSIASFQETLTATILLEASEDTTSPVQSGWLAAECGVTLEELAAELAPWESAGVVREVGGRMIEVIDAKALAALAGVVARP
jgi:CRP-like cAMP-binding protein/N-acyl-L-homoserine lactone synthetase